MIFEGNEAPEPEDPPQELPGPEDRELTPLEEDIRLVLKSVYDPEVPVDIYDLGFESEDVAGASAIVIFEGLLTVQRATQGDLQSFEPVVWIRAFHLQAEEKGQWDGQ